MVCFFFSVHQLVILDCCPSRPHISNTSPRVLPHQYNCGGEKRYYLEPQDPLKEPNNITMNRERTSKLHQLPVTCAPDHRHTTVWVLEMTLVNSHEPLLSRSQELPPLDPITHSYSEAAPLAWAQHFCPHESPLHQGLGPAEG